MEKPFVVYWTSAFAGKHHGYTTPVTKANSAWFETALEASKFESKLTLLKDAKATYRGRIVTHVSAVGEQR